MRREDGPHRRKVSGKHEGDDEGMRTEHDRDERNMGPNRNQIVDATYKSFAKNLDLAAIIGFCAQTVMFSKAREALAISSHCLSVEPRRPRKQSGKFPGSLPRHTDSGGI